MARPNKIDQYGLGPRVLTLGATMGSREIAAKLKEEGYDIGHVAIHRYLTRHLEERAEATAQVRAAVQAELQREALSDVQMLEKLRNMAMEALENAPPDARLSREWAAVLGQARAILETRIKIAGGTDDEIKIKVDLL